MKRQALKCATTSSVRCLTAPRARPMLWWALIASNESTPVV
jgi:hypothetical protein